MLMYHVWTAEQSPPDLHEQLADCGREIFRMKLHITDAAEVRNKNSEEG